MALYPSNASFGKIPWPDGSFLAQQALADRKRDFLREHGGKSAKELSVNELVAMQSLFSRAAMASYFNRTFRGKRDMYEACGYERQLTYQHYRFRYDRSDIAGRIVDIPAQYTWRNPPRVVDGDGPTAAPTEFQTSWTKLVKRLGIWSAFERLDRVAGIGRFAVMFVGIKGDDVNQIANPIKSIDGPDGIASLSVFGEDAVVVEEVEQDVSNERFGLPTIYRINLSRSSRVDSNGYGLGSDRTVQGLPSNGNGNGRGKNGGGLPSDDVFVHWSRIIHFAENLIDDEVYGMPRLQRTWNLLDDMAKVVGGSAETFWQVMDRGLQVDVDKEMDLEADDEKDLTEQLDRYYNRLQRYVRTRGVKINPLGSDVVNPRGPFSVITSLIVGTTGIPLRILFGPERGQFAVGEERTGWLESVNDRQEGFVEPTVLRPFVDRLVEFGGLPEPVKGKITSSVTATAMRNPNSPRAGMNDDSNYACLWPDLLSGSDANKADIALKFSEAAKNFADQGAKTGRVSVAMDEARQRWFALPDKKSVGLPEDDYAPAPVDTAAVAGGDGTQDPVSVTGDPVSVTGADGSGGIGGKGGNGASKNAGAH